jgi:hypothetical protein
MAGIYDERILGAKQQAETARKLREGISVPQGQMVSGWYVAPSITQHLANALKGYSASKQEQEAMSEYEAAQQQKQTEIDNLMRQANPQQVATPTPDQTMQIADQGQMNLGASSPSIQSSVTMQQPDERTRMAALLRGASVAPDVFQPQLQMAQFEMKQAEKEEARKAAEELKREQMAQNEMLRREGWEREERGDKRAAADRAALAYGLAGIRQGIEKPLPPGALKMQQEGLEKIGVASSINADLSAVKSQIDSGKLNLGMVSNALNKARNAIGMSTGESQALASFQSTLEKMRNDSLRLNNGVQTEGDSQRAWNELVANINDPKVVSNRLAEIQKINERGAALQQMQIDQVRANYGNQPLDVSGYRNVQPAIGGVQPQSQGRVRRFNPATGQLE